MDFVLLALTLIAILFLAAGLLGVFLGVGAAVVESALAVRRKHR